MKRREVLKGLVALGALALLPGMRIFGNEGNTNLHFVALGSGGTNALAYIHQKEIEANYTCITGPHVLHLTPDVKHIFWETPPEYRILGIYDRTPLLLTQEMKAVFSGDETFVILAGLGASVGTGLIIDTLEFLLSQHKNYLAICSLPFKNEGWSKMEYANLKKTELERFKNALSFDHNQIITHRPDVPTQEWAKYKYAKLAKLTRVETESLSDDAIYVGHNGVISDPGFLPIRERFKIGNEVFYSIFKSHFPNALNIHNSIG
jgi:hypothetical protein